MRTGWRLLVLLIQLVLTASTSLAQSPDISGMWQGALTIGTQQLRIVIKVSATDNGRYQGSLYSIDQSTSAVSISAITVEGSSVKMVIPAIGGTFQGQLDAQGNSITGHWLQGEHPLPLNLAKATGDSLWQIPSPPSSKPYTNPDQSFAVAAITRSNPESLGKAFRVGPGIQFSTRNTTVVDMIAYSYGVHPSQIENGANWLSKSRFDILAKPAGEGMPSEQQWRTMLQKLLAQRFGLAFHYEKHSRSAYIIVRANGGPKLSKSEASANSLPALNFRSLGDLIARNATITDFADLMQSAVLDKPVLNETGLQDRFDFELKWTPDQSQFEALGEVRAVQPKDTGSLPDLFTAIQEQLGLKISVTHTPVDIISIDRIAPPSLN